MKTYEFNPIAQRQAVSDPGTARALSTHNAGERTWRAFAGTFAVLALLLALNGCDRQGPAERAGERVDEAVQDMKQEAQQFVEPPSEGMGPAQEAGRALDDAREKAGEKIEQLGEDLQKP